jgi:predicted lipid-binding transport protein (Tim44 family)
MLTKKLAVQSIGRVGGLALLLGIAISAAEPAVAASAASHAQSITQAADSTSTDISAARRTRQARRPSPRDAYGSYVGGAGAVSPSYPRYGYGVGDNSRNQTW